MGAVETIRSVRRGSSVSLADPREPASQPPLPIATGVRGNGIQPAAWVGQRSMNAKLLDQPRESVLHDVLRCLRLAQHRERQPIHAVRMQVEE